MRALWCTLTLGWRNLGFQCQNEMPTLWCALIMGCRRLSFAFSERDANRGVYSFWVGETYVLHSQNEMRTLWLTIILGWRYLGFAIPDRIAIPMVRTRSVLGKPRLCIPRTRCEPTAHTHSGMARPRFCIPRSKCEPYGAHSFWVAETYVFHSHNETRTL
jgi:hypothetical protein